MSSVTLLSLLLVIKELLPLTVCVFTFIILLFVFKTLFRVHRNNPLSYVVSLITTICMYYAFIYIFGLSRTDYFIVGIKILSNYFASFGAYLFVLLVTITKSLHSMNLFTMFSLLEYSNIFFSYFRVIGIETCAYITLNVSYKFKKSLALFYKHFEDKIYTFIVYTFKANQINCVYTC